MKLDLDITILQPHWVRLQSSLATEPGIESSAYLQFGVSRIAEDPWDGYERLRLISNQVIDVSKGDRIRASPLHVTWSTRGYMSLLSSCSHAGQIPGLVHTHPGSTAFFSEQDTLNEAELARTAFLKGLRGMVSIVIGGDSTVCARMWQPKGQAVGCSQIRLVGSRWQLLAGGDAPINHELLDRQGRLFGPNFNQIIRQLKVAVIGCGGTGSPTAMMLARLGVGNLLVIDKDIIELTNLNRVHVARRSDAINGTP